MLKKPDLLKKGDKIAIVAPAGHVDLSGIQKAGDILSSWGLHVQYPENIENNSLYFAGEDNFRLKILQNALDDPELKAIIAARGGYGVTRIIDQLNFSSFVKFPKWIIGFSDITTLLEKIQQIGFQSIHGPMAVHFRETAHEKSIEMLQKALFDHKYGFRFEPAPENRFGKGSGQMTGGNLSLICNNLGTNTEITTKDRILFLEDVDEYLYNVDRMIVQLKRAGKLQNLTALCVGQFTNMKDEERPFGKDIREIILEHVSEYGYPLCFGVPSGHDIPHYPLLFGNRCSLNITPGFSEISFQ